MSEPTENASVEAPGATTPAAPAEPAAQPTATDQLAATTPQPAVACDDAAAHTVVEPAAQAADAAPQVMSGQAAPCPQPTWPPQPTAEPYPAVTAQVPSQQPSTAQSAYPVPYPQPFPAQGQQPAGADAIPQDWVPSQPITAPQQSTGGPVLPGTARRQQPVNGFTIAGLVLSILAIVVALWAFGDNVSVFGVVGLALGIIGWFYTKDQAEARGERPSVFNRAIVIVVIALSIAALVITPIANHFGDMAGGRYGGYDGYYDRNYY